MKQRSKKAVSPVLATLMMVAVAVAMSVIIFTWSQGFLSQTSEAAAGQQASQNIAAQSGIMIEAITTTTSENNANGTATIYLRNVGSVSFNLGSLTLTGRSTNTGFQKTINVTQLQQGTNTFTIPNGNELNIDVSKTSLPKGDVATITVNFAWKNTADSDNVPYRLFSGDVFTVKVTTKAGTFAQATYTVP